MGSNSNSEVLKRIQSALEAARQVLGRFTAGAIEAEYKAGHDPVTEADRSVDAVLRKELLREGEGWLSEESVDDLARLAASRVWVVEAGREGAVHYPAHGIGRIQTSSGLGGPGGCYIHSDSEARMGCGSRRRAGGKRWRIRAYIAELFVTVQQPITAYFRSFCMR